jgi:hypothetical protein
MTTLTSTGIALRRPPRAAWVARYVRQQNIVPRVALLEPMAVEELTPSLRTLRRGIGEAADGSRAQQQAMLREVHELLMRATPMSTQPPLSSLTIASEVLDAFPVEVADSMAPRPRTVFRLLRAGALDATWDVLIDNATGVVAEPVHTATSSGALRTAWRLPLLTRIEAPTVYADLPGFRDPRYAAADDCYDITDRVRLRHGVDEISFDGTAVTIGGWAVLEALVTSPNEQVRLVARNSEAEIATAGVRLRRPDLLGQTADALQRRAWAGWSAHVDLGDPRWVAGSWALSLELDHEGVSRQVAVGETAGELALAATRSTTQVGSRTLSWETKSRPWRLVLDH